MCWDMAISPSVDPPPHGDARKLRGSAAKPPTRGSSLGLRCQEFMTCSRGVQRLRVVHPDLLRTEWRAAPLHGCPVNRLTFLAGLKEQIAARYLFVRHVLPGCAELGPGHPVAPVIAHLHDGLETGVFQ